MSTGNDQYVSDSDLHSIERPSPSMPFNFDLAELDHDSELPLHHAVTRKDTRVTSDLLRAGTALSRRDQFGNEPIHCGVLGGSTENVQLLLQSGADINARGQLGRSPLHLAVAMSHHELARILLEHGSLVSQCDDKGDTPLHLALLPLSSGKESQPILMSLLKAGANVNTPNELGMTPFHQLIDLQYPADRFDSNVRQHITAALAFLDHGAHVSQPFPDGREIIEVFLMRSNDTWAFKDCGNSSRSHVPLLGKLLDKCRCYSSRSRMPSGEPLTHYYIRKYYGAADVDDRLTMRLCDLADPQLLSENGNTLLHELMLRTHLDIDKPLKALLRCGFDLNSRNSEGKTPLHLFFQTSDPERHLSEFNSVLATVAGYDINPWIRDNSGKCVLFEAGSKATIHSPRFLKRLLEKDLGRKPGTIEDWPEWEEARRSKFWTSASSLIFNDPASVATGLLRDLQELGYEVLAEKHLIAAKHMFAPQKSGSAMQQQRTYMAGILQDCRARHVTVDMRFYDEVLDLCRQSSRHEEFPPSRHRGYAEPAQPKNPFHGLEAYELHRSGWEHSNHSMPCLPPLPPPPPPSLLSLPQLPPLPSPVQSKGFETASDYEFPSYRSVFQF